MFFQTGDRFAQSVCVAFCISHILLQLLWETGSPVSHAVTKHHPTAPTPRASLQSALPQPGCRDIPPRLQGAYHGPWLCLSSPNTSLCWQQGKCLSLLLRNVLAATGRSVGSLAVRAFSPYKVKSCRYDSPSEFKDSCHQNAGFG